MSEPWVSATYWDRCIVPPVRCSQCVRFIPSSEAVEDLFKDLSALCDECYEMQQRSRRRFHGVTDTTEDK